MTNVNILIAFYSRTGVTEKLAHAVAEGARAAGADVRLRRARDFVSEDIIQSVPGWAQNRDRMHKEYEAPSTVDVGWADGIIFGTPTRFGNVSAELKSFVDSLGGLWLQGKLNGKAGAAFNSTSTKHGGNESTNLSMYNFMAHLGLVIVPLGYGDPAMFQAGTPYGATAVSGTSSSAPTDIDVAVARYQGQRVAQVAKALKAAGITQTK